MWVTSLCWWLYNNDWFQMLVTESLCWLLFTLYWWFSECIKSLTNILNRSPMSQRCHQHIWSATSVTNINVTLEIIETLHVDWYMMHFYPVSGFESDGFTFVAVTQLNKTRRFNSSRGKLTECHKQYVAIITDYYLFATISHLW